MTECVAGSDGWCEVNDRVCNRERGLVRQQRNDEDAQLVRLQAGRKQLADDNAVAHNEHLARTASLHKSRTQLLEQVSPVSINSSDLLNTVVTVNTVNVELCCAQSNAEKESLKELTLTATLILTLTINLPQT